MTHRQTLELPNLMTTALKAINLALPIFRSHPTHVAPKGDRDMVSDVDVAVQETIARFLGEQTPDVPLIAEEGTHGRPADGRPDLFWALDPIDGTANFVRHVPTCGISLALVRNDQPVLGVIDLPFLNSRYQAIKGLGALANDRPIHVARTERIEDSIVTFGDYAVGENSIKKNILRFAIAERLASVALRIRMLGSAATDLSWLAEGRTDISITLSNKLWDVAAGVVIARESGAVIMDIDGNDYSAVAKATVAANPRLRQPLLDLINATLRSVQA